MAPQTFEVKSNRWYRLTLRRGILCLVRGVLRVEKGGDGKAPTPYEIGDITIFVGTKEVVVQYPDRTDAAVSQKFAWNYVVTESKELYGYAWIVIDLGLNAVPLRLKMR